MAGVTYVPALAGHALGGHAAVAQSILAAAQDVFDAQPYPRPARGLIAVHARPEDCCDAITVVLRRLTHQGGGIDPACEQLRWHGEWEVTVGRDCDATLGSVYNMLPTDEQERAANELLMADAAALSYTFAKIIPGRVCSDVYAGGFAARKVHYQPGGLVPYRGGGCMGWTYDFRLSVPA